MTSFERCIASMEKFLNQLTAFESLMNTMQEVSDKLDKLLEDEVKTPSNDQISGIFKYYPNDVIVIPQIEGASIHTKTLSGHVGAKGDDFTSTILACIEAGSGYHFTEGGNLRGIWYPATEASEGVDIGDLVSVEPGREIFNALVDKGHICVSNPFNVCQCAKCRRNTRDKETEKSLPSVFTLGCTVTKGIKKDLLSTNGKKVLTPALKEAFLTGLKLKYDIRQMSDADLIDRAINLAATEEVIHHLDRLGVSAEVSLVSQMVTGMEPIGDSPFGSFVDYKSIEEVVNVLKERV